MKKIFLISLFVFMITGTIDAQYWYSNYKEIKEFYDPDDPNLMSLKHNSRFKEDFARNVRKVVLCHYLQNERDQYYPEIINEARKILKKKGYEVEVVKWVEGGKIWKESEFWNYTNNKSEEDDIVYINLGLYRNSKNYQTVSNSEQTAGRVTDASGRTIYEVRQNVPVTENNTIRITIINASFIFYDESRTNDIVQIAAYSKIEESSRDQGIKLVKNALDLLPTVKR